MDNHHCTGSYKKVSCRSDGKPSCEMFFPGIIQAGSPFQSQIKLLILFRGTLAGKDRCPRPISYGFDFFKETCCSGIFDGKPILFLFIRRTCGPGARHPLQVPQHFRARPIPTTDRPGQTVGSISRSQENLHKLGLSAFFMFKVLTCAAGNHPTQEAAIAPNTPSPSARLPSVNQGDRLIS